MKCNWVFLRCLSQGLPTPACTAAAEAPAAETAEAATTKAAAAAAATPATASDGRKEHRPAPVAVPTAAHVSAATAATTTPADDVQDDHDEHDDHDQPEEADGPSTLPAVGIARRGGILPFGCLDEGIGTVINAPVEIIGLKIGDHFVLDDPLCRDIGYRAFQAITGRDEDLSVVLRDEEDNPDIELLITHAPCPA